MARQLTPEEMPSEFDVDGFLKEPECWTRTLAETLAWRDGVGPLTDAHWTVIRSLREHYERYGTPPNFRHVCFIHHLERHCMDALFSSGREAWRIAGLPNPGEEAKAYM